MKNIKLNYHLGLKKTTVYKTVAVVIFAMVFNLINLGAFYKGSAIEFNAASVHSENSIGKMFANLSMPLKTFNDLLKKEMGLANKEEKQSSSSTQFALMPIKTKRAFGENNKFITFSSASPAKDMRSPVNNIYLKDNFTLAGYTGNSETVKFMLLFLILLTVLPRGIPVRINNFKKNINTVLPALF